MSALKLTVFGGMIPKASPRALNPNAAQEATDLSVVIDEFRPLPGDVTVVNASGVNNPKTIFRLQLKADGTYNTDFTSAAAWRVHAGRVSYAKWPDDDEKTDRHVVTFNDGSAAPRWIDATGQNRQLGVPKPATAPTAAVVPVDEFTVDERRTALESALQQAVDAFRTNGEVQWIGAEHPGSSVPGWLDYPGIVGDEVKYKMLRAYRLTAEGGTISDTYVGVAGSAMSWVFDPSLGGFAAQAGSGTPGWAGSAWHWVIPVPAYGVVWSMNTPAVRTALLAIARPGDEENSLLTEAQADALIAKVQDYVLPTGSALKPKLEALQSKFLEVQSVLNGGGNSSLVGHMTQFFAQAGVQTELNAAIENFARAVYSRAYQVSRTAPVDYGAAGP